MCTLIVAHRHFDDLPVLVAANRDEHLARPFRGPSLRTSGSGVVMAPTDVQAGGTWLGLNSSGVFAAITNRLAGLPDRSRSSRGQLVLLALSGRTAAEGARAVAGLAAADYNPFHLLVVDRETVWLVRHGSDGLSRCLLGPGVHIVTERSFGAAPTRRDGWLRDQVSAWGDQPPTDARLAALMGTHGTPTTERTCVHLEARGYGTRSSSILRMGHELDSVTWLEAAGPPCVTDHAAVDLTGLMAAQGAAAPLE